MKQSTAVSRTDFMAMPKAGFTLIELMIAMAIFVTAVTVALTALTSVTSLGKTIDRRNDLVIESQAIFKAMADDIALSGWATYDTAATDFSSAYATDRSLRYYPYVIQQATTGTTEAARAASLADLGGGMQGASPTWFTVNTNWFLRANNGLVDLAKYQSRPVLPSQFGAGTDFAKNYDGATYATEALRDKAYRSSFYARSQELIFVRATVGGWSSRPGTDTTPIIKFPAGDWTMSTRVTPTGTSVKDNHQALGVIRMSEWLLGDANAATAPTAGTADTRNPASFYWNRPGAPAGYEQIPVALNFGAMLSPQADPGNLVQIRWDSMLDPGASLINMAATVPDDQHAVIEFPTTQAGTARIKSRQLREYAYVLIPSSTGAGRLVRAHTEIANLTVVTGRAPWVGDCIGKGTDPAAVAPATLGSRTICLVVDKVFSDNCMRVVFDTIRTVTDGSLKPNQVRVTLYLAIGTNRPGDVPITYQTSTILTMRVLNSSVDNDSVTSLLGLNSPGLAN